MLIFSFVLQYSTLIVFVWLGEAIDFVAFVVSWRLNIPVIYLFIYLFLVVVDEITTTNNCRDSLNVFFIFCLLSRNWEQTLSWNQWHHMCLEKPQFPRNVPTVFHLWNTSITHLTDKGIISYSQSWYCNPLTFVLFTSFPGQAILILPSHHQ